VPRRAGVGDYLENDFNGFAANNDLATSQQKEGISGKQRIHNLMLK
jgi:hypothetical protein